LLPLPWTLITDLFTHYVEPARYHSHAAAIRALLRCLRAIYDYLLFTIPVDLNLAVTARLTFLFCWCPRCFCDCPIPPRRWTRALVVLDAGLFACHAGRLNVIRHVSITTKPPHVAAARFFDLTFDWTLDAFCVALPHPCLRRTPRSVTRGSRSPFVPTLWLRCGFRYPRRYYRTPGAHHLLTLPPRTPGYIIPFWTFAFHRERATDYYATPYRLGFAPDHRLAALARSPGRLPVCPATCHEPRFYYL